MPTDYFNVLCVNLIRKTVFLVQINGLVVNVQWRERERLFTAQYELLL
jgi:hypothetical protein